MLLPKELWERVFSKLSLDEALFIVFEMCAEKVR